MVALVASSPSLRATSVAPASLTAIPGDRGGVGDRGAWRSPGRQAGVGLYAKMRRSAGTARRIGLAAPTVDFVELD